MASSGGESGTGPRNFDRGAGNSLPVAKADAVAPGIEPQPPAVNEPQIKLRLDGGCFPAPTAPSRSRRQGGYPMPFHTVHGESLSVDNLQVVEPRGRRPRCAAPPPSVCTKPAAAWRTPSRKEVRALPARMRPMTDWLRAHGVTAAAMEGIGVYWKGSVRGVGGRRHLRRTVPCPARQANSRQEDRRQRQPVAASHLPVRPRPAELRSAAALPPIAAVDPLPP